MKKNPIIFIAMLIALAFTSCQMNTDDSVVIPPTYKITVTATNGTASYPKTAKAGEKVTITATADSGYVFDSASSALSIPDCKVSDDKKSITWNLTMPEKDVTINVTFKAATPAPTTEATSYKVVYGDQELKTDLTLAQVNAYITQISLVETTDYSIDKVKGVLTLTESGYNKLNSYLETNGEPTTTEPTDTNNGGEDNNGNVVYGSKRIILPTVEHGTIKITNKSGTKAYKDGNTVLSNAGADAGDVIEIKLVPDTGYNYFAYENTLTVTSIGSVALTKSDDTTYTFEMPNNDVEVNKLPFGFEKKYYANFATEEGDDVAFYSKESFNPTFNPVETTKKRSFNPGTKIYVKAYNQTLYESENGSFEDVTTKIKSDYAYANDNVNGSVTIDGVSISFKLKEEHKFYSFIMPRNDITLKFNLIQQ